MIGSPPGFTLQPVDIVDDDSIQKPDSSPKTKFYRNDELNGIFYKSKEAIIVVITKGIKNFDLYKPTCLHWSTTSIGYFLLQKHCSFKLAVPVCCQTG